MGIRISLFAVDVPAFEDFATHTLGYVLEYYAQHSRADKFSLAFYKHESSGRIIYQGILGRGVYYINGDKRGFLTAQQIESSHFLATKLNEHIVRENSYTLYYVLDRYVTCPEIDWVTTISEGHRRWWIGTCLQYAKAILGESDIYNRFANLLQRILRGYDTEGLAPEDINLAIPFSLAPIDDPDWRISFWTPDETAFICQTIHLLIDDNPAKFEVPSNRPDPDPNFEWNEIIDIFHELLALEKPALSNRLVLSFIG